MSTFNLEECQEHYEIDSCANGTMNILFSPLKGSWLKRAAPSSSPRVALLFFSKTLFSTSGTLGGLGIFSI